MIFEKQIEKIYRGNLFVRQDNPTGIFYFQPSDFSGLETHPYEFTAPAGHTLKGYFYHYPNPVPGRLVVFDHGMGNGHRAYMREIEQLCRAGFLVFSYDHTGCMESGGDSTMGFATSLSDLDSCIRVLKQEAGLQDRTIAVIGHSWGGFSTMNIGALHPEITHLVVMAGFVSVRRIIAQNFTGLLKGYRDAMYRLEKQTNPDYADKNGIRSLRQTEAKVLLIYSDNDPLVKKEMHYDELHRLLGGMKNIRFLLVNGKGHNPSFTRDAVQYKDAFFKAHSKVSRKLTDPKEQKLFMDNFDWLRMTEQDPEVWQEIVDHLNS